MRLFSIFLTLWHAFKRLLNQFKLTLIPSFKRREWESILEKRIDLRLIGTEARVPHCKRKNRNQKLIYK